MHCFNVYLHSTEEHKAQHEFVNSCVKRIIVRAGRRGGKTTGAAIKAVMAFLRNKRVLYATPTSEQLDAFWRECKRALRELIANKVVYINESLHIIEFPNTKYRIRAKTAWNADTLRGDYADLLILDEYQLMDETAWSEVGAPMLLDNNGDAVFIYTPPSLNSRSLSKARDKRHAAKLFKKAAEDTTGRWKTFTFTSHENPFISKEALSDITSDMSLLAIRQEIMAEDVEEIAGAIWTLNLIEQSRVASHPDLKRVVVSVDPPGGATECGIIVAGVGDDDHFYVLHDASFAGRPDEWGGKVIDLYNQYEADCVVAEENYGGDMVKQTIMAIANNKRIDVAYKSVHATRGKQVRAEPIQARYERGLVHHVGEFYNLEEEMVTWIPGQSTNSPNRLDALVWAITELAVPKREFKFV